MKIPRFLAAVLIAVFFWAADGAAAIPPPNARALVTDFDSDGRADLALWDKETGLWRFARLCDLYPDAGCGFSHGHLTNTAASAVAVPEDYDGDGAADPATFDMATGHWHVTALTGSSRYEQFGMPGDVPVPADYDGDGTSDLAVFRPATATWHLRQSSAGLLTVKLGKTQDRPVPADYDGDGRADLATYRAADNAWTIRHSGTQEVSVEQWGEAGDRPVPADYDGDGLANLAVFGPDGRWLISLPGNLLPWTVQWGQSGDLPAPADYDGDGVTQIAVYRPGSATAAPLSAGWLIHGSASVIRFGWPSETPVNPYL